MRTIEEAKQAANEIVAERLLALYYMLFADDEDVDVDGFWRAVDKAQASDDDQFPFDEIREDINNCVDILRPIWGERSEKQLRVVFSQASKEVNEFLAIQKRFDLAKGNEE